MRQSKATGIRIRLRLGMADGVTLSDNDSSGRMRTEPLLCTFALLGACRWLLAQIGLFCRTPSRGLVRRRLLWVRRCARLVALAAGSRWFGGGCEPVLMEGFLDAAGGGGADALVDRECL